MIVCLLSPVLLLIIATSVLWGAWWLAFGASLTIGGNITSRRKTVMIVGVATCLMTLPLTFNQISLRMDHYGVVIRTQGPESLSISEKLSIYLGNITMGLAGFAIGAPEVSIETLLLIRPNPGKAYSVNHDFAMGSPYIHRLVQDFAVKVARGESSPHLKRVPLTWDPMMSYSLHDYRVPLAIRGGGLRAVAHKNDDGYLIDCKATIDVRYSEKYKLDIFNAYGTRLYIDEAIFSALQDLGWLNPYVLHYRWTVKTDPGGNIISWGPDSPARSDRLEES